MDVEVLAEEVPLPGVTKDRDWLEGMVSSDWSRGSDFMHSMVSDDVAELFLTLVKSHP